MNSHAHTRPATLTELRAALNANRTEARALAQECTALVAATGFIHIGDSTIAYHTADFPKAA